MVLFDAIELSEFVQLLDQRVDHPHSFEQFLTALVVAAVLFS